MGSYQITRGLRCLVIYSSGALLIFSPDLVSLIAYGQTPNQWVAAGGGSWDTASNWSLGTVPNSPNAEVLFGNSIVSNASVSINTPRTVENITINNSTHQYTLTGSSMLTLTGTSEIDIVSGFHRIDVNLSGTAGFTKRGNGILDLPAISSLEGTISVVDGTLQVLRDELPGDVIWVESGATIIGDSLLMTLEVNNGSPYFQTLTGAGEFRVGSLHIRHDNDAASRSAQLRGNLTIDTTPFGGGEVRNGGLLAPGLVTDPVPVGTLTIAGDYLMEHDAELEIEVGGSTPGTQHDQVVVNGFADLTGQLTVPLVNGYVPNASDVITLIEASGINLIDSAVFNSVLLPNLGLVRSDLSVEISQIGQSRVELQFVAVSPTPIQFANSSQTFADWSDDNWSNGSQPSNRDNVILQNQHASAAQRVSLSGSDDSSTIIHQLDILGNGGKAMTLEVFSSLSIVDHVSIASGGELNLNFGGGKVVSRLVSVVAGGRLTGRGSLTGDVVVGSGGILSPGYEPDGCCGVVGNVAIQGDLTLAAGSELRIQPGDNIDVVGDVQLGGKLVYEIEASEIELGFENVQMFMSVDSVIGQFDEVEIIAPEGYHFAFVEFENEDGAIVVGTCGMGPGDMNCDDSIDMDDVPLFAQALIDPDAFRRSCPVEEAIGCVDPPQPDDWGDVDFMSGGNNGLDFDDIDDFAKLVSQNSNITTEQIVATILAYNRVPEPTSFALFCSAACWFAYCKERCRR